MIYQIYEQELNQAFESLLSSVDIASEKALKLKLSGTESNHTMPLNGLGVELQGKILYFKELIFNLITTSLEENQILIHSEKLKSA